MKKRLKATRKARIEASKRLRKKNDFFEKVTYFYSLVILILSVWFLNKSGGVASIANKILLVLSLSLTYFTMFISMKNYKERAGNFETNYQQLDVLNNKIDRFGASGYDLDIEKIKEFQREYEKLNIGKENHINIDYYISTEDNQSKFKKKLSNINIKENIMNTLIALYPFLLLLIIYLFSLVMKKL